LILTVCLTHFLLLDYKTDAVIQSTLRSQLNDVTVITVAHRLQTIMDADKIVSVCLLSSVLCDFNSRC